MDRQASTYLDDKLYTKLKTIAGSQGLTVAAFLRMQIIRLINDSEKETEKEQADA